MATRAVEDGALLHVSASQIKEFASCERKWFLNKVLHLPQPETAALATGTRLHGQLEDYWAEGLTPEHPSLQRLIASPKFPTRGPHLLVEHPRDYNMGLRLAGVPVRGRMDFLDWSDLTSPHVWDLKSSSNFSYALTPEALSRDIQLSLYAKWTFTNFHDARVVYVSHAYAHTQKQDAKIVTSDPLTHEHVDGVIGSVEGLVERMAVAATYTHQEQAPGNSKACEMYRGCPYKGSCTHYLDANPDYFDSDLSTTYTSPPTPGVTVSTLKEKLAAKAEVQINPPDASRPVEVVKYGAPAERPPGYAPPVDPRNDMPVPLHLYVNCTIVKGEHMSQRLEDLIAEKSAPLLLKFKVSDVRQVEYGKGTAELMALFAKDPPTGVVYAQTLGLSGLVVDVLMPLAERVTWGS